MMAFLLLDLAMIIGAGLSPFNHPKEGIGRGQHA
jgi:hypothetical protein